MDNVCHTLVGLAVARAGLRKKTALATSTAAIAANLPDIDVLVFATSVPSVAFRRGITHGVPAQLLLPIAFAGVMWLTAARRRTGPPAHFWWLLAISYIGVLSHVFLDFLNTYGIRFLSPMSQRWFYGDAVFIVDLWLWLILAAGVVFTGMRVRRGAGATWPAVASLAVASAYIGAMLISARVARGIVRDAWIARAGSPPATLMVGPVPFSPFRRTVIVDAGDRYVEGVFHWLPARVRFADSATPRGDDRPIVALARQDPAIRYILIWSRFPVWETREVAAGTEVTLRDMRFRGIDRGGFSATTVIPR